MGKGKLVFVRHGNCAKNYLFRVPDCVGDIHAGDAVLVMTKKGKQIGTALMNSFEVECVEGFAAGHPGATLPLAEVVGVVDSELRRRIVYEEGEKISREIGVAISSIGEQLRSLSFRLASFGLDVDLPF